ncbi:uncharacterized protein DNG_01950 [Cephalotrichum gorgonifer]|uniref:Uncharacterized protein n=1 Tax=Cephalotrichum gorgonifer TaxID=2041049 RepID=A0AAE8MTL7_9PEZI|nr:uncharacterized protein DNG_01950 [Cephalotrichum gorgonifer]
MGYHPAPHAAFPQYASPDAAFEEWSRQLAASQVTRRPSRSSNGPRSGNAMRITKPGSTNSSPRASIIHARRRTLVNDGNVPHKRQQPTRDQVALPMPAMGISPEPTKRSQRPVSWHPASSHFHFQGYQPPYVQQPLPQQHQQQHPARTAANQYHPSTQGRWNDQNILTHYQHMSPMPPSYSCQASPVTPSPLSLPYNDFNSQPTFPVDGQGWGLPAEHIPSYVSPPPVDSCSISPAVESNLDYTECFPPLFPVDGSAATVANSGTDSTQDSGISDWRSFVEHGFDRTFPPTPENLPQMQQLKHAVQSEESTHYKPLEEPEDDDSEILVGMGLYDPPEKHQADPGLNNYRSTLSSLLGSGPPKLPEVEGKGLKLEETWEPPESDGEDEDDDDEQDEEDQE